MLLRELFEAPGKTAVVAFGRLNPPTVGHAKLVDTIKSYDGDHYLFLSHTQKPKTDPLDFATKMKFAKQFFPGINIGHQSVNTPVAALEFLQKLGYTDVIFVAGSDRVAGFQKLFDTYNGQPDKTGKVPFKFNSIKVESAGERDPDADDVSGMSASKMRALAAQGELNSFAQGVPDKKLAKTMYDAVRKGMGVKDTAPAEDVEEGWKEKLAAAGLAATIGLGAASGASARTLPGADPSINRFTGEPIATQQVKKDTNKKDVQKLKWSKEYLQKVADGKHPRPLISKEKAQELLKQMADEENSKNEAAYKGNIGIMELFKFFAKAEKQDPDLVAKVKKLISQGQDKMVWKIVQDYTGTKLVGKEFEGSIAEAVIERACKNRMKKQRG